MEDDRPEAAISLIVPTVLDRFVQQAALQVLQGQRATSSYGFRPGRSSHQAVARAQEHIAVGPTLGGGYRPPPSRGEALEKFFDWVNHDLLMGLAAKRVCHKRVLRLIRGLLTAGVLVNGLVGPTDEGTSQSLPLRRQGAARSRRCCRT